MPTSRTDYSAPPAVFGLSHTLGDSGLEFEVYTQPAGFLTKQATRSGMITVHRQVRTHGHNSTANTNAANQQVPKRRVFTTNKPSGTMIIYPLQRHINLPHYTATGANLLITLQSSPISSLVL